MGIDVKTVLILLIKALRKNDPHLFLLEIVSHSFLSVIYENCMRYIGILGLNEIQDDLLVFWIPVPF